ncbi:MAG: RNA polymerase sigma factor [Bacteroidota bacterium]
MTPAEFNTTVSKTSRSLRPFAMRLTRDSENANDLLQDTMLKALLHRDKFTDGTNLKAWLYTIMKNTFITNYQRMMKKKTFIDTTDNLHYLDSLSNSTQNLATASFVMAEIDGAISSLEEAYRAPFMMYFTGYKYYEIADKLHIPIGTVKNRIHLARKELKHSLRAYAV